MATTVSIALERLLFLLGTVLVLFGLYDRHQSEATDSLGFVGFLVAFLGTALSVGTSWGDTSIVPILATRPPSSSTQVPWVYAVVSYFAIGWLLFGVATLRARVYPR